MQSLVVFAMFSVGSADDFLVKLMNEKYKYSVVRIVNVVKPMDFLRPYETQGGYEEDIGSGWAVDYKIDGNATDDTDIIFATNAHVIRDGRKIFVQLPSLSRTKYAAFVPLVSFQFDIALVKLVDPQKMKDDLQQANVQLHKMKIDVQAPSMGTPVWTLGYPLGSNWLKLSKGVVAGSEKVFGYIVHQSTAPISPGNSGGPLVMKNANPNSTELITVVCINFASSVSLSAENNNYCIPGFRIAQVLSKYAKCKNQEVVLDHCGSGTWHHVQLKIAPVGVVTAPSSDAQIQASKCKNGIVLSKFKTYSMFKHAYPPIQEGSFLTKVDNTSLDNFGMGARVNYMGGQVDFQDLLTMRPTLDSSVPVTMCRDGVESHHRLSLVWDSDFYEPGVKKIYEARYAKKFLGYEVFAGITLMDLTQNHVDQLMLSNAATAHLSCFYQEEKTVQPRVVITAIEPGSSADEMLTPGMIINSINGVNVSTLKELRNNFQPDGDTWQLQTDRGDLFVVSFKQELLESANLSKKGWAPLSKAVAASLKIYYPQLFTPNSDNQTNASSFIAGPDASNFMGDDEQDGDIEGDSTEEQKQLKELAFTASKGAEVSSKDSSLTDKLMQVVNRIVSGLENKKELNQSSGQSQMTSASRSAQVNAHGTVDATMRRAIVASPNF